MSGRRGRAGLALVLLVAVLVLPACGGDGGGGDGEASGPSSEAWVQNLCDEGVAWQKDLNRRGEALAAESGDATSVADVQATITRYFRQAAGRTDQFIENVEKDGPPDAEGGERVANQVDTFLMDIRTAFADFADEASKIPTDNPTQFQTEIQQQLRSFTSEIEQLGEDFENLDAPDEFDRAFDDYEPCQEFQRGAER